MKMSVLKSEDGKELIVSCSCGCDESVHIIREYINEVDGSNE